VEDQSVKSLQASNQISKTNQKNTKELLSVSNQSKKALDWRGRNP
jgi:hypothetical protein